MTTHKHINIICVAVMIFALAITILFMNGESLGIQVIVDEDAEENEDYQDYTSNDVDGDWDTSDATVITLKDDTATISGSGAYLDDDTIMIVQSGYYVISGNMEGKISVNASNKAKVWIMLDGVTLNCEDDACFRIENADKVFLTLAEGSENSFTSGEDMSAEATADGTNGAIYAHDDLTINGSGSLEITAGYKHGITAKDDLVITGGNITITCPADGIHTNDKTVIKDANLTIHADDDGIHSTDEIIIKSGTIYIDQCYEGIESKEITMEDGDVTIYPTDDGFNATDGSSSGFSFGMMSFGKDSSEDEDEDSEDEDSDDDEYVSPFVVINGGTITIINEDANDADGIDSNADIVINGGYVYVSLNGNGSNNALDYGSENGGSLLINGGVVVAAGGSSMVEDPSENCGQATITYIGSADAGTELILSDASGNTLIDQTVDCSLTAVILSSPDIEVGQTYTITLGDTSEDIEVTSVATQSGSSAGGMGGMGSMGGGMGGGNHGGHGGFSMNWDSNSTDNSDESTEDITEEKPEEKPEEKTEDTTGDTATDTTTESTTESTTENTSENTVTQMQAPSGDNSQMTPPSGDGQMPDMSEMPSMPGQDQSSDTSTDSTSDQTETSEDETTDSESSDTSKDASADSNSDMQHMGGGMGQMQMGDFSTATTETTDATAESTIFSYDSSTWTMFGICLAALILGLIIAKKFKRR